MTSYGQIIMKRVNKETATRKREIAETVFRLRKEQIGIERWIEFIASGEANPEMPIDVDFEFADDWQGWSEFMNVEEELQKIIDSGDAPTDNVCTMANIMIEGLNEINDQQSN